MVVVSPGVVVSGVDCVELSGGIVELSGVVAGGVVASGVVAVELSLGMPEPVASCLLQAEANKAAARVSARRLRFINHLVEWIGKVTVPVAIVVPCRHLPPGRARACVCERVCYAATPF